MPIDDPVKKLVHDVLFQAACKWGPKGHAAEAELRARGDLARADMARLKKEHNLAVATARVASRYGMRVSEPTEMRGGRWSSPA